MAVANDANSRNRLISKTLDVGRRGNDATSGNAADHTEAVESPINSFAQAPSSADKLRSHEGPLDTLLSNDDTELGKGESSKRMAAPELTAEDFALAADESGENVGTIDGSYGPKTLEAKNLFQQEQIDALKLLSNTLPNTNMKAPLAETLARQTRLAIEGVKVGKEHLSSLSNTDAKSLNKASDATSIGYGQNNDNTEQNNEG